MPAFLHICVKLPVLREIGSDHCGILMSMVRNLQEAAYPLIAERLEKA